MDSNLCSVHAFVTVRVQVNFLSRSSRTVITFKRAGRCQQWQTIELRDILHSYCTSREIFEGIMVVKRKELLCLVRPTSLARHPRLKFQRQLIQFFYTRVFLIKGSPNLPKAPIYSLGLPATSSVLGSVIITRRKNYYLFLVHLGSALLEWSPLLSMMRVGGGLGTTYFLLSSACTSARERVSPERLNLRTIT